MQHAGVAVLTDGGSVEVTDEEEQPACQSHTGTVMVFTTPSAQRSFLSFFPSDNLSPPLPEHVASAVSGARVVVIEGAGVYVSRDGKVPASSISGRVVMLA